jgi:hypothetical protein
LSALVGAPLCIRLSLNRVTARALRTLRLLGVTYLLQPVTQPRLSLTGVSLIYDGRDARIYRIPGALPRAFVAGGQQVVGGGEAALAAITRPAFDVHAVAVSERRLPDVPVAGGAAIAPAGSAQVVHDENERVVVRAQAARPGVLVLTDTYFPGWKAKVDGRDASIAQVDYVLRGVPLSAGSHRVVFSYEPASWRAGWIISSLALLALALALIGGQRCRRDPRRAPRAPNAPRADH